MGRLMNFWKIIVYAENRMKHIKILSGKYAEVMNVKVGCV
jgi:hypothetical protein